MVPDPESDWMRTQWVPTVGADTPLGAGGFLELSLRQQCHVHQTEEGKGQPYRRSRAKVRRCEMKPE